MWILVHGRIFCNINNRHPESSSSVIQSGICTKIDVIPYMFRGAYTDCYILYRARRYLIAFLGIFIFVGCVVIGTVFADLRIKKETARKNLTVSRWFYCTGDIIRIIPIRCMIRKKYSDGRPFKSHLKRISPEVWLFCIEAKMAIFSRKQCSSKKPHYAYIFCRFLKEMLCPLGASLRSAWESVRFASERSRVRLPSSP